MKNLQTVTDDTFDREVLAARGDVLVEFGAAWCPPCRALEPVLEAIARERTGSLKVVAVDIDASPASANRFGVRAAPTLVVFREGRKVASHVGAIPKARVLALVDASV
jgi:thioredoxin 1